MAKKPRLRAERVEVTYNEVRWMLLRQLRAQAIELMKALKRFNIESITHGSIARGDVSERSDIDIFILTPPPSFLIETALENAGFQFSKRLLVQATPFYAIKGHIEIDEQRYVSFPLVKLRSVERDFYKFGGELSLPQIESNLRVLGVDKRLMLIEPTQNGHIESTIVGREEAVAKVLGVKIDVILDRVRALSRRDRVGRTGVFIKKELLPNESFETVLKQLSDKIPAIRKRVEAN